MKEMEQNLIAYAKKVISESIKGEILYQDYEELSEKSARLLVLIHCGIYEIRKFYIQNDELSNQYMYMTLGDLMGIAKAIEGRKSK